MRHFGDRWSRSDVRRAEQKEEIASKYPGVMPSWPRLGLPSSTRSVCTEHATVTFATANTGYIVLNVEH